MNERKVLSLLLLLTGGWVLSILWFWFGFATGRCEQERLKVQYTVCQTFSMTDSLTVLDLTPR